MPVSVPLTVPPTVPFQVPLLAAFLHALKRPPSYSQPPAPTTVKSYIASKRTEIAAIFAICDCDTHRGPQKSQRFPRQEKAMLRCDLRVRWKVASDLRFRAATSEAKTPDFCRISGDLVPSTRKSLAIAIVRFWCAKHRLRHPLNGHLVYGQNGVHLSFCPCFAC